MEMRVKIPEIIDAASLVILNLLPVKYRKMDPMTVLDNIVPKKCVDL